MYSAKTGLSKGCIFSVVTLFEVLLLRVYFTARSSICGATSCAFHLWNGGYFLSRLETRTKECNMLARV